MNKKELNKMGTLERLEQPSTHINEDSLEVRRERPIRKFTDKQGPLAFPEIPGFRTYIANFTGDEFDYDFLKLLDKGYEPVLRKEIEPGLMETDPRLAESKVIIPVGRGTRGILLKIPLDWWKEDYEKEVVQNNSKYRSNKNQAAGQLTDGMSELNGKLKIDTKFIET